MKKNKKKFELFTPPKELTDFAIKRTFDLAIFALSWTQSFRSAIASVYFQGVIDGAQVGKKSKEELFEKGSGI